MDSDARAQLFDTLKNAYIPPFLEQIFQGLADVMDPRRPGLQYFATLAGFWFTIDFGRLFLPLSLLQMHNLAAEYDTSRRGLDAMYEFLTLECIQVFSSPEESTWIRNGNFLSTTNDGIHRSQLFQAFLTLLSPVTGRSLIRRTNMEPVDIPVTPTFNINQDGTIPSASSNPYTLFLNASPNNVKRMSSFIQDFSNIVKNEFSGVTQLGAVPDIITGVSILNHGYSLPALPTWSSASITLDENDNLPNRTDNDFAAHAKIIKYLQPIRKFKPGNRIPWPEKCEDNFWSNFYLTLKGTDHDAKTEPDKFLVADPELHETPRCFWLQPYTEGDQPIAYSMICGLLIESAELDGASIPAPDPSLALRRTNNAFLQGSVPARNVNPGYVYDAVAPIAAVNRHKQKNDLQAVSLDLYNLAESRLPKFDSTIEDPDDNPVPHGFSIISHVRRLSLGFSKLSFREKTNPPSTKKLPVWSPYRYLSNPGEIYPTEKDLYFLVMPRCMYGTHIPLIATEHPFERIPIT